MFDDYLGKIQEVTLSSDTYATNVLASTVGKTLADPAKKLTTAKITNLRKKLLITCDEENNPIRDCNPLTAPCLFNIIDDPCERKNVADIYPATFTKLQQRMTELLRTSTPVRRTFISDPQCDPSLHMGVWDWWVSDIAY